MSFKPKQAGLAEGLGMVFVLTIPRMFLTSLAVIMEKSAQLSWASVLLAGFYTLAMVYMLLFVIERVPGDFFAICKRVLGKAGAWLMSLAYLLLFWLNGILLLRNFAENTIINALPDLGIEVITILYAIIIGVIVTMGVTTIIRTSYVFLPYLVMGIFIISALLYPYYNIYRLFPWRGNGLSPAFLESISAAGFDFGVIALIILAPAFQSLRTIRAAAIYGLGLSTITKVVFIITYTIVFGTIVGAEKSTPFAEMARLVYLGNYFQHIESLLIILWVIIALLAMAANIYVVLYLFTRLLDLPEMWPLVPLMVIITANIALLPESFAQVVILDTEFVRIANLGIYVLPTILFLATLYKMRKKSCVSD